MASGVDLRVRISADLAEIKSGLGVLRGELAKVKAQAATSAPNMTGWTTGIAKVREQLSGLLGAYLGFRAVGGVIRGVTDAFDRMDRIEEISQMVALSAEDLSKFAYAAQFSGVELEALGKGFSFFQRTLGKNSELLGKLGVNAPDLIGKLRQIMDVFKQLPDGPEKASLAAELFGSKLGGNLIPLLNEGADGFDRLGNEAERTGNVFDKAALEGAAKFNDNMGALKSTMMGVFNVAAQQLAPSMTAYAVAANAAARESDAAAEGGKFLATVFKVVATGGVIVKNVIEAVVGVLGFLADVAIENGKIIITSLGGAFTTVGETMKAFMTGGPLAAFATFTGQVKKNGDAILGATRKAQNQLRGSFDAMRGGFKDASSDIANAFVGALAEVDKAGATAKQAIGEVGDEADAASKKGDALRKMLAALFGEGGGKDGGKAKEKAKAAIAGLVDQSELALDQVDRDLDALDQRYEEGTVKLAAYFAQRQVLELQQVDLKLAAAEADAAAAKSTEEQSRALTEIIKLQRDRAEIGPRVAREQAKAEREAAAATLETLSAERDRVIGNLRGETDYINSQSQLGGGALESERQLQRVRAESLEQLQALAQRYADYLAIQSPGSPQHQAALDGLRQTKIEIASIQTAQRQFQNDVANQAVGAIGGFFDDLIDGAKSFKEAFTDMVRSFLAGVAKMIAQELALRAVQAALRAFGGGSANGNAFNSTGQMAFAKGAAFTGAGLQRFANGGAFTNRLFSVPTAFAFGKGGQFGVMGEAGPEAVMPLTRGPNGRLGVDAHGAGAGARKPATYVLAVGDDQVANAMAGAAGEEVVLMHVRQNWGALSGGG